MCILEVPLKAEAALGDDPEKLRWPAELAHDRAPIKMLQLQTDQIFKARN